MARGNRDWGAMRWPKYVPVEARRRKAEAHVAKLKKKGEAVDPVQIEGRQIASTFWGKAWCENLEAHSDFANRLPRGRTYVRNGSVMDLRIGSGEVKSMVSGSSIYKCVIKIATIPAARRDALAKASAGKIDSLIDLLQGRLSEGLMRVLASPTDGFLPLPREMSFSCSCPDFASLCKHVAASLYGVGARLDREPHLLFALRGVVATDFVASACTNTEAAAGLAASSAGVDAAELSDVFGIELVSAPDAPARAQAAPKVASRAKAKAPAPRAIDTRPAKSNGRRPTSDPEESVTAAHLLARGATSEQIDQWVELGALRSGDRAGRYGVVRALRGAIESFIDGPPVKVRKRR